MKAESEISKLTAADVMSRDVLTVPPDMSLEGLAMLFTENHVTGAPVVDDDKRVVGVISETDLVHYQASAGVDPKNDWSFFRTMDAEDVEELVQNFQYQEIPDAVVKDLMTTKLVSAEEHTPISDLAKMMLDRHVHRVLVTHKGRLSGIVSTMDLLRVVAGRPCRTARAEHRGH